MPMLRSFYFFLNLVLLAACGGGQMQRLQLAELERQNRADSVMLNDTLASALASYFDRHGTSNEQLRAYYILGRTYADRGETSQALQAYNDAIERADTTDAGCDYAKLSRVHAQKAELFYYQLLPDNMILEERMAVHFAQLAKDTMQYLYCYGMLAEGYDMKDMPDSALLYLTKSYNLYKAKGIDDIAASLCCSMADIYLRKDSLQRVKNALFEYETKTGFFDNQGNIEEGKEVYYYIKGLFYIHTSLLDSAEYFFRKELALGKDINNQLSAYKGLQMTFERKHEMDSLVKYTRAFIEISEKSHNEIEMQHLLQLQASYNYTQTVVYQKIIEAQTWNFRFWVTLYRRSG